MLVGDKYRHYGNIHLSKKSTLASEDNMSFEETRMRLKDIFGLDLEGIKTLTAQGGKSMTIRRDLVDGQSHWNVRLL